MKLNGTRGGTYIHGTDPEEQARLALMNDPVNVPLLAQMRLRGTEVWCFTAHSFCKESLARHVNQDTQ